MLFNLLRLFFKLKARRTVNSDYGGMPSPEEVVACMHVGVQTGELRQKFQVSHENQVKSFTAGALGFNSDYKLFSSCKGRSNEYGVKV